MSLNLSLLSSPVTTLKLPSLQHTQTALATAQAIFHRAVSGVETAKRGVERNIRLAEHAHAFEKTPNKTMNRRCVPVVPMQVNYVPGWESSRLY